jgi:endonuclease/exonuclease/phosphatase family metal-dependent hydrolase
LVQAACQRPLPRCEAAPTIAQRAARESITVVSFNLYNRPFDRTQRLSDALGVLTAAAADVIALQEVAHWFWEEIKPAPICSIAQSLGMNCALHWHEQGGLFHNGLAILTHYPILDRGAFSFSEDVIFNSKGVLYAVLETPAGPLAVINVHLASVEGGPIKATQFRELQELVQTLRAKAPVLIVGDFNQPPATLEFRDFIQSTGSVELFAGGTPRTWAGAYGLACDNPRGEFLDTMVVTDSLAESSQFQISSGSVIQPKSPFPSDHCPIVGTLTRRH